MDSGRRREKILDYLPQWQALAAVATIIGFLSGLSFLHAYYRAFGFGELVLSFPLTTYLTFGGLSIMTTLIVEAAFAVGVIVGVFPLVDMGLTWWMKKRERVRKGPLPLVARLHPSITAAAIAISLVLPATYPWQWLIPTWGLPGIPPAPTIYGNARLSLLLGVITILAFLLVILNLSERHRRTYTVLLFLLVAPWFTQLAGEGKAAFVIANSEDFMRAHVLDGPHEGTYLIVHQEGPLLYLFDPGAPREAGDGRSDVKSVVVDAEETRVEFLGPKMIRERRNTPAHAVEENSSADEG